MMMISYVRPLLQLQTVTSVLMIRSDEQFSLQIATERGWKVAALRSSTGREFHMDGPATAKLRRVQFATRPVNP